MKSRILVITLALVMILSTVLAACGETDSAKNKKTAETTAVQETTVVLETTAEGGTVEQDSEGNQVTKNASGKVIAVKDKSGNPVDVAEYVASHPWVETSSGSGSGSAGSGNSSSGQGGSSASGSSGGASSSGGSGSSGSSSSDVGEEMVEESIPVVIATIPDEEDMIVIADP